MIQRILGAAIYGALLILAGTGVAPLTAQPASIPAFPGAEGFGMFTPGGRGGDVHLVTNLDDDGAGSLRAALEAEGPRIVVFHVAGVIELERPLVIEHPFVTVAGQTAPGTGVVLKNYALEINAHDVVVRHLRVRPGDVAGIEQDAISIRGRNIVLDHCSASWGTDETVSVSGGGSNVTIQWCLIAESLDRSVHHKGSHGYGSLLSGADSVTIHHTVYAFHQSRNPRPKDVLLDFRNNLIYGFGQRAGYNIEDFTRMNYVGNVIQPLDYSDEGGYAFTVGGLNTRMYVEGNVRVGGAGEVADDWQLIRPPRGVDNRRAEAVIRVDMPFATPSVTTHPAREALAVILDDVGATKPRRDAVDRRVVGLMEAGEGRIIDSQAEVGGWSGYAAASPPPDADSDGMPDAWEQRHGLDPAAPDDAGDLDDDGYTNIEEYFNDTDPRTPFAWVPPPEVQPPSGTAFADSVLTITITPPDPDPPVHYTVDGTEPMATSPRYTEPIEVADDVHLRGRAITDSVETTSAFAAYERLRWLDAAAPPPDVDAGLRYAYYEAADWDEGADVDEIEPEATGRTTTVNPSLRRRDHRYALVYDGYLRVREDGVYAFYLHDDARSRLFVDDRFVVSGSMANFGVGRVALRRGLHRFHYRSLHEEGGTEPRLEWEGPEIARQPISGDIFFRARGD